MPERDDWLTGGRVGRAHGLDGSFHVTRPRGGLLRLGVTVRIGDGEAEIVRADGTPERPIVRLADHETRAAADALRGAELLVARSDTPELGDDEWWPEDLEGCRVVDGSRPLGEVRRMLALPSCDVLEVTGPHSFLVPLVRDAVRSVDVDGGVIDIDAAFLGELGPGEGPG